jgi:peptide/nickel transport system ATP-binding protein
MSAELLRVEGLSKRFADRRRTVAALDDVSFSIGRGETLGIVGPSGSGKSTLARVLLRLIEPDAGRIMIDGEDWRALSARDLRRRRGSVQMVFQHPLSAFNPRTTIGKAIMDPLRIHTAGRRQSRVAEVGELLRRVGLAPDLATRRIHEISGGQRQRVALARALASGPRLVVLDEALSALDVSLRGQMLELIVRLQKEEGISFLFIGHDPAVVRLVSHRVAIMDHGRIVEAGDADSVLTRPQSETGKALITAIPAWR